MFLLWGYSLVLTYRAWYKLLYSAGEESGNNMWRYIMDMVKIKRRNENRQRTEDKSTKQQDFEDMGVGSEVATTQFL